MLMEGQITNGHAKAILGLEDKEEQRAVAQKVVEEQLSVRDTKSILRVCWIRKMSQLLQSQF